MNLKVEKVVQENVIPNTDRTGESFEETSEP